MFDFIAYPIGGLLKFIYEFIAFKNYGFAIIILTIFVKTVMLPLYIKQYNSTLRMSEIQPQLIEIQKKYKNDNEKLNIEMMNLYKKNKISPAGGCLPLFIQMPILFSLYYVISQPLKYMFDKSDVVIKQLYEMIPVGSERIGSMHDLSIINYFSSNIDQLPNISLLLGKDELINMNFLGINLGLVPTFNYHLMNNEKLYLLLIPILATVTTYISLKYSTPKSSQKSDNPMQDSMLKSMNMVSPIMTGFISFTVPSGLGLYWIVSNIYQVLQQVFINKFIAKNSSKEKIKCKGEGKEKRLIEKTT